MKHFHTIGKWMHVALDVWKSFCWNIFDVEKVFQTQNAHYYLFLFHHTVYSLGKSSSTRRIENSKPETRLLHKVTKVILQAWNNFHGKWPTIIPSFTATMYLSLSSSCSLFYIYKFFYNMNHIPNILVVMVTTYTTVSFTNSQFNV